jgi:uncharacterized protein YuzE
MNQKLNKVHYDSRTGTVFIALRPKSQRRATASLEYPGRIILDLDAEGDLYGVRLLGARPEDVEKIFHRLKAVGGEPAPGSTDAGEVGE